ncbi:MAG: hypothetical protein JWO78_2120 [Micavibrio sp.]|nr:hypothetical protein [Micavibrio sp.]
MKKQIAAITTAFALAGLGATTGAEAHDRHGHHSDGRDIAAAIAGAAIIAGVIHQDHYPQPYYAQPQQYYAPPPPPVYYRPPVYVAPQLPPVEIGCYERQRADRYGYPVFAGSVRTYQNQNNGAVFQRSSRQPCF